MSSVNTGGFTSETPPWHRTHSAAPSPTHVWFSTRMQTKSDLAVHPDFCDHVGHTSHHRRYDNPLCTREGPRSPSTEVDSFQVRTW